MEVDPANAVVVNEPATTQPEPETVPKTEHEAVRKQLDELQQSHKALQRTLHNERQRGSNTRNLEQKLEANEKLLVGLVEVVGKLGVEGVDTSALVTAHRTTKAQTDTEEREAVAAAEAIVGAFKAAGIPEDQYDEVWLGDKRFEEARNAFDAGQFQEALKQTVKGFTVQNETLSKAQVKEMIDAAVAADRQARAATVPASKQSTTSGASMTYEEWAKLPVAERRKHDYKAALRKEWQP